MASKDPTLRPITIRSGVLKRCSKEKLMYQKEAVDQEARIERMKQEGKDEYDIKKQHEVLGESMMMIPDCDKRIKAAYHELKNLLDAQTDAEVLASKEFKEALELLEANVPAT